MYQELSGTEELERTIITEFDKPQEHISAAEYINHAIILRQIIKRGEL